MGNKMDICLISHSSRKGGAERSLLELIDALRQLGMNCKVIFPKNGPLVDEIILRNIDYTIIPYHYWVDKMDYKVFLRIPLVLWNLFISIAIVFKLIKWKSDLVITQTVTVCSGAIAAKLAGISHIWNIREFGSEGHGYKFHLGDRISFYLMHRLSILCVANSHEIFQKYKKYIPPSKLKVLHSPILVDKSPSNAFIPKRKENAFICIIIGVVKETKRQEDAIRSVRELKDQGIIAQLWIVGGGYQDYIKFLKNLVNKINLADQVSFLGPVDNAFPYIEEADVLLLCSRHEAYSRVVVEGMRAVKPVIGTKSGGTVEQIRDGFNGFLYEPGDYKELARHIKYLYENPEKAKRMGANGKEMANTYFTMDRYRKELLDILKKAALIK